MRSYNVLANNYIKPILTCTNSPQVLFSGIGVSTVVIQSQHPPPGSFQFHTLRGLMLGTKQVISVNKHVLYSYFLHEEVNYEICCSVFEENQAKPWVIKHKSSLS
jgi:hypothetical protein